MSLTNEDREWIAAVIRESEARNMENMERTAKREAERVETSLLTAFHQWASPNDQKLRTHREALRALDLQIEEIAGVPKLESAQDRLH